MWSETLDPSASQGELRDEFHAQMPRRLRLSFSSATALAMAVGSLTSHSSFLGHQLRFSLTRALGASRVRSSDQELLRGASQTYAGLGSLGILEFNGGHDFGGIESDFPLLRLASTGNRRRALPHLPSF